MESITIFQSKTTTMEKVVQKTNRRPLSLKERMKIVERWNERKTNYSGLAAEFDCSLHQIKETINCRHRYIFQWGELKGTTHPLYVKEMCFEKGNTGKINQNVYSWYTQQKKDGFNVTAAEIKKKASYFAIRSGNKTFKASKEWFRNFQNIFKLRRENQCQLRNTLIDFNENELASHTSNANTQSDTTLVNKEYDKSGLTSEKLFDLANHNNISVMGNICKEASDVNLAEHNVTEVTQPKYKYSEEQTKNFPKKKNEFVETSTPIKYKNTISVDIISNKEKGYADVTPLPKQYTVTPATVILLNLAIEKGLLAVIFKDQCLNEWVEIRSPIASIKFSDSIFPTMHFSRIIIDSSLRYYMERFGQCTKKGSLVFLGAFDTPCLNYTEAYSVLNEISGCGLNVIRSPYI